MQAYMHKNWMQVLDADKLLPVMDAASIYASKVFQMPVIIVIFLIQAYMQPNWMQILDVN